MVDVKPLRQMLTPLIYQMADVIAILWKMLDHNVICYNNWQMLLPGGRWNSHHRVFLYSLVDVMAGRQMDFVTAGRCYCHMADGMATRSD